ncbi:MAG: aspartyl protease family protein [Bacteroidaceae bacterium]|nr:aspartyl protease family protein [Bacteroidaceae bacterium]
MKIRKIVSIFSFATLLFSCGSNENKYDPYAIASDTTAINSSYFEVDFKKTDSNLKTVHIKLNDTNGYDALFDTGCSGMLISSLELIELLKNNTINTDDYLGDATVTIADGTQVKHPMYNIREVKLVDKNGKGHSVRDIVATVVDNPGAEILIGSSIIDNLAKKSYTVDLKKKVIRFE